MKLLIAESQDFSPDAIQLLKTHFVLQLADLDRTGLLERVADCEILWVRLRNMIDAEVMDAAPLLKVIATNTTGLNHIDLEEAETRGIEVVSLRGEVDFLKTIRATVEHTIALTLALLRKIPQAYQHVLGGGWDRDQFQGSEIYEKTVGIIGYGRLGRIVATYFAAFGATVVLTSRDLSSGMTFDGMEVLSLEQLLGRSDIISLHVNYDRANHHMLGSEQFREMKQGAIFINTARGELVDELALAAALASGHLAGAAIDVVDGDTGLPPCLASHTSVSGRLLVTPHIGGNTEESRSRTEVHLARMLVSKRTSTSRLLNK